MDQKKDYITPVGFKKLQKELRDLKYRERPEVTKVVTWAASNGDRSENADYTYGKRRLREIDSRMHYLIKRLESLEVVDPKTIQSLVVRFGASVTYCDGSGVERTYTIVGVDEIDLGRNRISWRSPIGRALLGAKVGDWVTINSPKGSDEVEVLVIRYEEIVE